MTSLSTSFSRVQDYSESPFPRVRDSYTPNFSHILDSTFQLLDEMRTSCNVRPSQSLKLASFKAANSVIIQVYKSPPKYRSEYKNRGLISPETRQSLNLPKRDAKSIIEQSHQLISDIQSSLNNAKAFLQKYGVPPDIINQHSYSNNESKVIHASFNKTSLSAFELDKTMQKSAKKDNQDLYTSFGSYRNTHSPNFAIDNELKSSLDASREDKGNEKTNQGSVSSEYIHVKDDEILEPKRVEPQGNSKKERLSARKFSHPGQGPNKFWIGNNNGNSRDRLAADRSPDESQRNKSTTQRAISLYQDAIRNGNGYTEDQTHQIEVSEIRNDFGNSSGTAREAEDALRNRQQLPNVSSYASLKNSDKGRYAQANLIGAALEDDDSPKPDLGLAVGPEPQPKMQNEKISLTIVSYKPKQKDAGKDTRSNYQKSFDGLRTGKLGDSVSFGSSNEKARGSSEILQYPPSFKKMTNLKGSYFSNKDTSFDKTRSSIGSTKNFVGMNPKISQRNSSLKAVKK